jgi:MoaA/NifB/PqqE/SkfB family radical SAM enzyme
LARRLYKRIVPNNIRSRIWNIKNTISQNAGIFLPAGIKKYFYLNSLKKTSPERLKQRSLLRFEINIVDHCNLNCMGCEHFSPIAEEKYIDVDNYKKDCERIAVLTSGEIESLHLMGGEPLLHPRLAEILDVTRECFKKGAIEIVTNGVLLLRQETLFWQKCRENRVKISITQYPIKLNYSAIEEKAGVYNVELGYYFVGIKTMQKRPLDGEGKQNGESNFKICHMANNCIQLRDGKLYPCVVSAYIPIFNKFFKKNFEVGDKDYIDIYRVKTREEMFNFLCKPIPFCRYCNIKRMKLGLKWGMSRKEICEWI